MHVNIIYQQLLYLLSFTILFKGIRGARSEKTIHNQLSESIIELVLQMKDYVWHII